MSQSKKHSAIESITNVIVGLVISFLIQIVIYPLLGIPVTMSQNLIITLVFFVASFIRGFIIRRIFNQKQNS
jgi:membrane protein YdbS with pleckstrin-like domain